MDESFLTVLVLFAAVLLRVALILGVIWLLVPRRAVCPHCREATFGLQAPRILLSVRLQRRWCPCGWDGLSKLLPTTGRVRLPSGTERFRRIAQP